MKEHVVEHRAGVDRLRSCCDRDDFASGRVDRARHSVRPGGLLPTFEAA